MIDILHKSSILQSAILKLLSCVLRERDNTLLGVNNGGQKGKEVEDSLSEKWRVEVVKKT